MASPQRPQLPWDTIETEFRAGQMSNRQLAEKYGCSEAAIRKRARQKGWEKDLQAAAQREHQQQLVRQEAPDGTDEDAIRNAADHMATIAREHRDRIRKLRQTAIRMHDLLDDYLQVDPQHIFITDDTEEAQRVADLIKRMNHMVGKNAQPVDVLLRLTQVVERVIELERNAWALDDPTFGRKSAGERRDEDEEILERYEDMLGQLDRMGEQIGGGALPHG